MEADFSGWATKSGLKCADGRTIMPDAFSHQDKVQVPLVWQHGHDKPENVLGHVILSSRDEGVWAEGFFNKSAQAQHARELLEHKDIDALSIWANGLVEKSKRVFHGIIREVSLVLSGANPGARITNVTLRHSDTGEEEVLEDEAIIFSGEFLKGFEHAAGDETGGEEETLEDVYNTLNEKQMNLLHFMLGEAVSSAAEHSDIDTDVDGSDFQAVYDTMSDKQKDLLHFMIGEAAESAGTEETDTTGDQTGEDQIDDKKGTGTDVGNAVKHNVFENGDDKGKGSTTTLSHDAIQGIMAHAKDLGSMKAAVEAYAEEHLEHGIQDIDTLFPEARTISNTPELFSRRTEWVNVLLQGVKKNPFSRIKTMSADLTVAEARAKGYITGSLKKEEFFRVKARITTPQTIYKKQKLDRDDILDITDFDVVAWLKGEMRIMLDEELARAILVGDGRAADDEDKINEDHIRPVAGDHELYTTVVNIEFDTSTTAASNAAARNFGDRLALQRRHLRGTGLPTMFTTETYLARLLIQRDDMGRKVYKNTAEIASDYRVADIVTVEVLEEYPNVIAVIFNPVDYTVGADRGGNVNMFDDFDIDYNQQKYLIETRVSGALTKLKSAMVVMLQATADNQVAPAAPTFDGTAVTIVDTPNVTYRNADTDAVMTAVGSPYPVAEGTSLTVVAQPAAGFYVESSEDDDWTFTNEG